MKKVNLLIIILLIECLISPIHDSIFFYLILPSILDENYHENLLAVALLLGKSMVANDFAIPYDDQLNCDAKSLESVKIQMKRFIY